MRNSPGPKNRMGAQKSTTQKWAHRVKVVNTVLGPAHAQVPRAQKRMGAQKNTPQKVGQQGQLPFFSLSPLLDPTYIPPRPFYPAVKPFVPA
jgi:hypothetical protein